MFEVKHRVLSEAVDESIGALTAAVSLLGALQGLCWIKSMPCVSVMLPCDSRELLPCHSIDQWGILLTP